MEELFGTHMQPVDRAPLSGEALQNEYLGKDDASMVGFSFPCQGDYVLAQRSNAPCLICKETNRRHGHIIIECEDGVRVISSCIFSRPFLEKVVMYELELYTLEASEAEMLLRLDECKQLAETITPEEERTLTPEGSFIKDPGGSFVS